MYLSAAINKKRNKKSGSLQPEIVSGALPFENQCRTGLPNPIVKIAVWAEHRERFVLQFRS
jgi:hypothetical protein